jgi:hypothetical protein
VQLLEWLLLVALGDRRSCGFLITLGGCHHLDGLEQRRRIDTSWWLFVVISRWFVRGLVPSPAESQKITLVDCLCHWVNSLVDRLLRHQVLARCVIPISRRTTKCWSTQWELACWQACEPREKNWFSYALDFSWWLNWYSLIGSSLLPRRYNLSTHSLVITLFTFLPSQVL